MQNIEIHRPVVFSQFISTPFSRVSMLVISSNRSVSICGPIGTPTTVSSMSAGSIRFLWTCEKSSKRPTGRSYRRLISALRRKGGLKLHLLADRECQWSARAGVCQVWIGCRRFYCAHSWRNRTQSYGYWGLGRSVFGSSESPALAISHVSSHKQHRRRLGKERNYTQKRTNRTISRRKANASSIRSISPGTRASSHPIHTSGTTE